jgi:hypothetical protein
MADDAMSWEEHADELRGEQRALSMIRAMISDDEAELDAVLDDLEEVLDGDPEHHEIGLYHSALAGLVVRFGVAAFGLDGLQQVLVDMQNDLARHIAGYDPAGAS